MTKIGSVGGYPGPSGGSPVYRLLRWADTDNPMGSVALIEYDREDLLRDVRDIVREWEESSE